MDERIWLHHPVTGGYFHCPVDAAQAWRAEGWQPSDPPTLPNPAVAERVDPSAPTDRDDKKVKRTDG